MILITGCARSGTTLTASVLRACGARFGEQNSLGESRDVTERVVKPYLRSIGADPLCQDPLPELEDIRPDPDWRGKVLKALGSADALKCPKIGPIWPVWWAAFPEARWIVVRRNKDRIVDSCLRTGFMRAFKDREGWGRWVDTHLQRFEELKANADCIEVWPNDEMTKPEPYRDMIAFVGLDYDRDVVTAEFQPGRWHG